MPSENPHFPSVFTQFGTFGLARGFMEAKSAFLRQFMASSENRHFKSVLTQIITFRVGGAFIVVKAASLRQLEVFGENRNFKSVFSQISTVSVQKGLNSRNQAKILIFRPFLFNLALLVLLEVL